MTTTTMSPTVDSCSHPHNSSSINFRQGSTTIMTVNMKIVAGIISTQVALLISRTTPVTLWTSKVAEISGRMGFHRAVLSVIWESLESAKLYKYENEKELIGRF
jgi:hypothetical protein